MKKLMIVSVLSLFMLVGCSNESGNVENDSDKNTSNTTNIEEVKTEEFKIYGFDGNVEFKTVVKTLNIDKALSKEEKLKILFDEIYKNYAKNFKMEIKLRDDNIVELNILNVDEIQGDLTSSAQIEGFTYTFIDSLLQKEYAGDWISGVQVLNNGEIDPELGQGAFEGVYKR